MSLATLLLLVALIAFILAALPIPTRGLSLTAIGLACLTGAMLAGGTRLT